MVPSFASANATISRGQSTGVITITPTDSGTGQGAGSAVDSRVNVVITQSGSNLVFTEQAYADPSQDTPQLSASGSGSGACTNVTNGVSCPTGASGTFPNNWVAVTGISASLSGGNATNGPDLNDIGLGNNIDASQISTPVTITYSTATSGSTMGVPLVFHGGSGADNVDGSPGKDLIEGNGGADDIDGKAGDDHLVPGAGADTVLGGAGNDYVGIQAGDTDTYDCGSDPSDSSNDSDAGANDIVGRDESDPWTNAAVGNHDCTKMAPHFSDGNDATDDDLKPGNFDFGSATVTAGSLFEADDLTISQPTLGGPPNAFQMYWYVCDTAQLLTNPNPAEVDDLDPGEAVRGGELPSSDTHLGGYIRSDCTLLNSGSPALASDSITVPSNAKGKYLAAFGTMGLTTTAGDIPWAAFAWDSYGITWTPKRIPYPDTDGDGFTDEVDAFPSNPLEWADADGDGHGDNYPADPAGDRFPSNPLEWADADGDGHGDNYPADPAGDRFPGNSTQWADADNDGYGDNPPPATQADNCVNTPNPGQEDLNHDGIGDACADDIDGDGVLNAADECPNTFGTVLGCPDTDGDGYADSPNSSKRDWFPNDPNEWADDNHNGTGDNADAASAAAQQAAAAAAAASAKAAADKAAAEKAAAEAAAAAAAQQQAASLTPLVTPSTSHTTAIVKPSNKFTLKKTKVTFKGSTGTVKVTTSANGKFTVKQSGLIASGGRYVSSFTKSTSKKAASLKLSLTKAGKTQLKRKGTLTVRMALTFKPTGGTASTPKTLTVVFRTK